MSRDFTKPRSQEAKSWITAELIKSKCQYVSRGYRLKEIIQDFRKEYNVELTYVRAWRAREAALSTLFVLFHAFFVLIHVIYDIIWKLL